LFKAEDLDYDSSTVIRRELSPGGKSRAFINDTPVTLEVMKRVGDSLMDIHSQHETLLLGQHSFQLKLVDAFAANQSLRELYSDQWSAYLKAKKDFETLSTEAETLRQEADYIRFQLDELSKLQLEESEQESLESELKIMEHSGEIKNRFQSVLDLINNSEFASRNSLAEARNHLQNVSTYSAAYAHLFQRLESVIIELDDLTNEIEKEGETIEFDPERAEWVKERLSAIYRLLKKHKAVDLKALLVIQENLAQKNTITSNIDEHIEKAKESFESSRKNALTTAQKLSASRKKVVAALCKQITQLLQELGIPNATFQIDMVVTDLSLQGTDKIEILFSANKGIAPRPIAQVASGGEFSRLMFCIKYVMAEKTEMPTLVLDEIDSGVSGEVAFKLGSMMRKMSERHQLIAISHLPQIAARGNSHYFVYKDNTAAKTISSIKHLQDNERIEEIAKMIGGDKPSKVAFQNAQELLAQ
jgi:DNA repair protein RecN (Recombination protein N)